MSKEANGWGIMCSNVGLCRRHKVNVAIHRLLVIVAVVTVWSAILPSTSGLPLDDFYPFDLQHDNKTEVKDDGGSDLIQFDVNFPFFNTSNYRDIYVNNNGIISFKDKITVYKPLNFSDSGFKNTIPLIAPFWADVDIKNVVGQNETIVFRLTSESAVLNRSTEDVRRYFVGQKTFYAREVLIVTWFNVGFYGAQEEGKNKRNTFQAVLITDGESSYAIFNYNRTVWTTGSNSGGGTETGLGGIPAVVGFHAGVGKSYVVANSGTDAVVNITFGSNVDVAGKYIFRIDGEEINDLQCAASDKITIEPSSVSMLGGDELQVTGPCLTEGQKVKARIRELELEFQCVVTSDLKAVCVTPSLFKTGELTFELDSTGMGWNYSANLTSVHLVNMQNKLVREEPESWYVNGDWWRVNVDTELERLRNLTLWSYKHNGGTQPRFEALKSFRVEKSQPVRKFKLDTIDSSAETLIISLCWNSHENLLPVCIWSDVFPVRWNDGQQAISERWCENWLESERQLEPINIHAPYCPCVVTIAESDVGHFHRDPICDIPNCTYYPNAQKCFRRNIKRSDDSGETCCYNAKGELLDIRESPGSGTHQRYHYKAQGDSVVPFFSFFVSDLLPKLHCCQYSSKNCSDFVKHRNATSCQGYTPPSPALAAGDPHIVTLDGLEYSFNGVGEYYLVYDEVSSLVVQVRAVQALDNEGNLQNATVFSNVAVAVQGSSDIVEIRHTNDTQQNYEVLVNKFPIDSRPASTSQYRNISLYHNDSGSFLIVVEPVSVTVRVEVTSDLLNIIVLIGEDSMRGNLRGLLGNYNGNKSDDLIPRYGVPLPSDSSMRDIHFRFGQTWNVSSEDSVLSTAAYNVLNLQNFQPVFIDELSEPTNATKALCGDDKKCQFDLSVTGKESIALETKMFGSKFEETRSTLTTEVVRCPYLPTPANGNKTQNESAENSVATFTCDPGYERTQGDPVRVCQANGTWSGSNADFMCAIRIVPDETESVNKILIGAIAAAAVFAVVIGVVVFIFYRRRKTKEPEIPIQIHVIAGPVFADPEYYNALMNISRDGPFKVPRPHYVDPQIFTDYF